MGNIETFKQAIETETPIAVEYRQEIADTARLRRHDPIQLMTDPNYTHDFPKRVKLMEKIWINAAHEATLALRLDRTDIQHILLVRPGVDHRSVEAVGREENADEIFLRMRLFASAVRNITAFPQYNPSRPHRLLMTVQNDGVYGNKQTPFQQIAKGMPSELLGLAKRMRATGYDLLME